MRPAVPVQMIVAHTTGGNWPQEIRPGAGPAGHALDILDMWRGRDRGPGARISSASHIVIDLDGTVFCAADLALHETYHAQAVNPRSIGIEMCTVPRNGASGDVLYRATLDAMVTLCAALTCSGRPGSGLFPIPFQHPAGYGGAPIRRLEVGGIQSTGADVCGIIGHRNQTGRRGRGDPGDEIMRELQLSGSEAIDFDAGQDLEVGRQRQRILNDLTADNQHRVPDFPIAVDGICGRASIAAMRMHGLTRWRDVPTSPA